MITPEKHPILTHWLSGSTCSNWRVKRSVLFENEHFIVLKHSSHSEYLGRWSGSVCCGSYAHLYLKSDFDKPRAWGYGNTKPVIEWKGRLSIKKIRSDCAEQSIFFENAP